MATKLEPHVQLISDIYVNIIDAVLVISYVIEVFLFIHNTDASFFGSVGFQVALAFAICLVVQVIIFGPIMIAIDIRTSVNQNAKAIKELYELKYKFIEIEKTLSKYDNVNLWSGVGKKNNN